MKEWPLSLERTQEIVEYLIGLGTREGLIYGDILNSAMGASARRRANRYDTPTDWLFPPYPKDIEGE